MSPRSSQPLTTEFILLGMIAGRAVHGYDLFRELQAEAGLAMIWRVKRSMFYALLDKLATRGYLAANFLPGGAHPPRKEFSLTAAGQEALVTWRESPVDHPRDLRQDFLARLFFAGRSGRQPARALIQRQRDTCCAWLDGLRTQLAGLPDERDFERWVISFRILQIESTLAWLDGCGQEAA